MRNDPRGVWDLCRYFPLGGPWLYTPVCPLLRYRSLDLHLNEKRHGESGGGQAGPRHLETNKDRQSPAAVPPTGGQKKRADAGADAQHSGRGADATCLRQPATGAKATVYGRWIIEGRLPTSLDRQTAPRPSICSQSQVQGGKSEWEMNLKSFRWERILQMRGAHDS